MAEEHKLFFDRLKAIVAEEFGVTPEHLIGAGRFGSVGRFGSAKFSEAFELLLYFIYEYYNHTSYSVGLRQFADDLGGINQTGAISNVWARIHKDKKFSTRLASQIREIQKQIPSLAK